MNEKPYDRDAMRARIDRIRLDHPGSRKPKTEWPWNLLHELYGEDYKYADPSALESVLSGMPLQDEFVLRCRYQDGQTYQEIGGRIDRSRERARQLIVRALRKLRHPAFARRIRTVPAQKLSDLRVKYDALSREYESICIKYTALADKIDSIRPGRLIHMEPNAAYSMPLDELGLSARPYNVLWRHEIEDIGGLVRLTRSDIMNMTGMGKGSLKEIESRLGTLGLSLRKEDN